MPLKKKKKVSKFVQIFDYKMIMYDIGKFFAIIPTLLFLRLKIMHINKKRPKGLYRGKSIVVSNHTGYIDPAIISYAFWCRRINFVATDELFKVKGFGLALKAFKCIPINKENVSVKTFKEVKERLERGHLVGLFPEGQVETQDNLVAFKSGAAMMALMSSSSIIPMYIHKRTKWYKRQVVMLGEKINIQDYISSKIPSMEEMEKFTLMLHDIEQNLKEECIKRLNRRK